MLACAVAIVIFAYSYMQVCENGSYNLFKTSREFPLTKYDLTMNNDFKTVK